MAELKNKLTKLNEELSKKAQEDYANNNHILTEKLADLALNVNKSKSPFLFDSALLAKQIVKSELKFTYKQFELKQNDLASEFWIDLGNDLVLRPLRRDDFDRGYMQLLSQLTVVGDITREIYEKRFDQMKSSAGTYFILVVADLKSNSIAGSITLVFEQKFIRTASSRGRIEDVVVDNAYRGKGLSKILLDVACQLSKKLGNYKLSLECKDDLKALYGQFGFALEQGQNYMCQRF